MLIIHWTAVVCSSCLGLLRVCCYHLSFVSTFKFYLFALVRDAIYPLKMALENTCF